MTISSCLCCLTALLCVLWSVEGLFFGRFVRNDLSFLTKTSLAARQQTVSSLPAPNDADIGQFKDILQSISKSIFKQENDEALRCATSNLKFLFTRNLPLLVETIISRCKDEQSVQDTKMAYVFVSTVMGTISSQTKSFNDGSRQLLRGILDAVRVSESQVDHFFRTNLEELSKPEFLMFLDTELESSKVNPSMENLLITVKLKILEEYGRKHYGVDVTELPKIAALTSPSELAEKTLLHIADYDSDGKKLLLQSIRIIIDEMQKKYKNVDQGLIANLREIERIISNSI